MRLACLRVSITSGWKCVLAAGCPNRRFRRRPGDAQVRQYRYIVQGEGSGAAGALIEAVNKWNERIPDKTVLFLNYASNDPELTNSKCSFWYYNFDAHNQMKVEALTIYMAKDKSIKKVFVLGQDYAHGQQLAKESLQPTIRSASRTWSFPMYGSIRPYRCSRQAWRKASRLTPGRCRWPWRAWNTTPATAA